MTGVLNSGEVLPINSGEREPLVSSSAGSLQGREFTQIEFTQIDREKLKQLEKDNLRWKQHEAARIQKRILEGKARSFTETMLTICGFFLVFVLGVLSIVDLATDNGIQRSIFHLKGADANDQLPWAFGGLSISGFVMLMSAVMCRCCCAAQQRNQALVRHV